MSKPIKSSPIDLNYCTQVIIDITDLLQLPESESDPDIKKSTPGQNAKKSNLVNSPNLKLQQ